MKKSLRTPVLLGVVALSVIVAAIPVILFAAVSAFPVEPLPLVILFWISFGASLACGIVYPLTQLKGEKEVSILYLQLILTVAIQLSPLVTWLFFFVTGDAVNWIFVIPLIIDLLAYLAYALIIALTSRLAGQAKATLEKIKSEQAEIVNPETTFNNEDGTFKGSRVKVNKDK